MNLMVPMVYGMKCNLKLLEINFSKWKEGLGGNLDLMVSGSAALQPRLARILPLQKFR
jgi:long-subunit acyl-CoA synthetase (AMP-forming)